MANGHATPPQSGPPGIEDFIWPLFGDIFGEWAGLVWFVVILLVGFFLWLWKRNGEFPLVSSILPYLRQPFLPRATPGRFSVAMAKFANDEKEEHFRLVSSALQDIGELELLLLDRVVRVKGQPEKGLKRAQERARNILKKSGAQLLIWGEILRQGENSVAELHWITAQDVSGLKERGKYAVLPEKKLALDEEFFADLVEALKLLVLTEYAGFEEQDGRYVADRLRPFIDKVRRLLEKQKGQQGWDAEKRASVQFVLADALSKYGGQRGEKQFLREAAELYNLVLATWTQDNFPYNWAIANNNLGNTLVAIGRLELGIESLTLAEQSFTDALTVLTKDCFPDDWAMAQNNLGTALGVVGEKTLDKSYLKRAGIALKESLSVWTRDRDPLRWACTQSNLGSVLSRVGEFESGTENLEKSVQVHREVLEVYTRKRYPLDWAMSQSSLGHSLVILGERVRDAELLGQAVQAFEKALEIRTQKQLPLQWAETIHNLGDALRVKGEIELDCTLISQALGYHLAAWESTEELSSHHRNMAVREVFNDLHTLCSLFSRDEVNVCLEEHNELLDRFRAENGSFPGE